MFFNGVMKGMGILIPVYALVSVDNIYLQYILMIFLGGAEAFAYLSVIMKITTTVPPEKMGFIHVSLIRKNMSLGSCRNMCRSCKNNCSCISWFNVGIGSVDSFSAFFLCRYDWDY